MLTFHECCQAVVDACKDPKQVQQVNYAFGYACSGLLMSYPDAVQVQAIYILNNITRWRGDIAKEVRASLKIIGKVK